MNIEDYLKRFQFKKISPEVEERIWQSIERKLEGESNLLIDRLWNWKWAVSTVTIILLLSTFNLHIQKYSEKIIPVASYKEEILDPETEKLFAFLDKNPEVSLLDYLKYIREKKEEKNFRNYILKIKELTG